MPSQQSEETKQVRVVLVTHPSHEEALRMAEQLVSRKLVACVNIVQGVQSVYLWKGEVCRSEEVMMVIKTVESKLAQLESAVNELHPYEVPEFLALKSEHLSTKYLSWVFDSTT